MKRNKFYSLTGLILTIALLSTGCGKAAGDNASTDANPDAALEETATDDSAAEESAQSEEDTSIEESSDEAVLVSDAPDWVSDAVLYEVNVRQYTESGTFNEFSEHLETLKDMGINTLWFMPIHPISKTNRSGVLGSYYSVDDYRAVNPEFGTEEDFKALVDKAHEMGFHVMLDWVANHTGWDNAWITEHPDWYTQKDGKIISPEGMGWPDVADLNYDNADMRLEMIDCMKYWVEEYDIDGFRCDYAPGVPRDFWDQARTALDEVKDIYMLEEDLGWLNDGLLEYAFDSNYNSKIYENLVYISKDTKQADKMKLYLPKNENNTFTMNYLDNHDVNAYDRTIAEAFGPDVLPSMYTVIFTLPGVPMIYSGDEIAYGHMIKFMERDPIDWDAGEGDYRELISQLSALKADNDALWARPEDSSFELLDGGNKNIFVYERKSEDEDLICLANLSKRDVTEFDFSGFLTGDESVIYSVEKENYGEGGENPAGLSEIPAWSFYIIQK